MAVPRHRRRAEDLPRARANDKIKFITNHAVLGVDGDTKVTGLRLRDNITGEETTLAVTGVFVAIGHEPRSSLVRIATGRDAADTAFLSTYGGTAQLLESQVTAIIDGPLPFDNVLELVSIR